MGVLYLPKVMETSLEVSSPKSSSFIGVSELFEQTIAWYKNHWKLLVTIQAIPLIISLVSVLTLTITSDTSLKAIYSLTYAFLGLVASGFSWLALMWVISREDTISWKEAYKRSLTIAWPSFIVVFLTIGIVLGGFILLIIPGIYLAICYTFTQYALFADNKRGMEALRASKFYVKDHWWGILVRVLLFGIATSIIQAIFSAGSIAPQWDTLRQAVSEGLEPQVQTSPILEILGNAFAFLVAAPLSLIYTFLMYKSLKEVKGEYITTKLS